MQILLYVFAAIGVGTVICTILFFVVIATDLKRVKRENPEDEFGGSK